jgi:hypothetical protein
MSTSPKTSYSKSSLTNVTLVPVTVPVYSASTQTSFTSSNKGMFKKLKN